MKSLLIIVALVTLPLLGCSTEDNSAIKKGVNSDSNESIENNQENFLSAVRAGSTGKVEKMLNSGLSPNLPKGYGPSPLEVALVEQQFEIFSKLLEYGADPNTEIHGTKLPVIFWAIVPERFEYLELLVHYSVDVNADLGAYGSPLLSTLRTSQYKQALLLLQSGAKPNQNIGGNSSVKKYLCQDYFRTKQKRDDYERMVAYLKNNYGEFMKDVCNK